jgi:LPS-assembly lipoprotein
MSCSERRRAVLGLGAAALFWPLAGCGFRPLYATAEDGAVGAPGNVRVESPPGREGYYYQRALRRRLGEAGESARWRLATTLAFDRRETAITVEADVTRYDVLGSARWRLFPVGETELAAEGVVDASSAYNTLAAPYATAVAERDALRRVSEALAQRVFVAVGARLADGDADAV